MNRYSKLIAAIIGLAVLAAMRHFDFSLPGFDAVALEWVVSAATAFGVYQVRNAP